MKARHKDTGEIIELAEEGIISCDGRRFCWYQVELIPEPIDDFKPSLPSNIDEAAEEYGGKEYSHAIHFWDEGLSKNKPEVMKEDFVDAFKAGAEWQKSQMKKGAVEGYVTLTLTGVLTVAATTKEGDNIGIGDKVRIIIVKEG